MIKNYIKVAFRTLLKNKFFSIINIFGLALSMAVCVILIMLVADQQYNDAYNPNKDRIYRVIHNRTNSESAFSRYATAPLPVAQKLLSDYPGVDYAVRIRKGFGNDIIGFEQDLNIPVAGLFVDPEFLDLFDYKLLNGSNNKALNRPNTVVLKEETARKIFGSTDVVGKVIHVGEQGDYIVTGIIKDNNEQSHIKFDALASLTTLEKLEGEDSVLYPTVNNWLNRWAGYVYLQLHEDVETATVLSYLEAINQEQYADLEEYQHKFELQALGDISPGPLLSNEIGPGLPMIFVYFMGGLALIVMLSAAFNYMNLSIARALTRAREVGVRKVSGATRGQLIVQFLTEAIILSFFALLVSYFIVLMLKPAFSQLHFSNLLRWDLRLDERVILFSLGFSILVGLLAGGIPAITLSAFQPSRVLKQLSGIKLFSRVKLRKALIISQFSLSLIFIISTTLVYNQLQFMLGADFGFTTAGITNVRLNNTSYSQFKTAIEQFPEIEVVAAASHIPASGETKSSDYKLNIEDDVNFPICQFFVDENYLEALDLELLAGSNFTKLDASANEIIINEKGVEELKFNNLHEALGQYIFDAEDSTGYKIVGVVKNYNHQMLILDMAPMILIYRPEATQIVHVKANFTDQASVESRIKQAYTTVNPGFQVDQQSFSNELAFYYDILFGDITKITALATLLCLIIACFGLLGMATYSIETRTKEVGIRKVLGASGKELLVQLSKSYVYILLIAIIIALPIAYFANNLWLQHIAYRVEITAEVISLGVFLLIILGLITISTQTYRALKINPVESLKNE